MPNNKSFFVSGLPISDASPQAVLEGITARIDAKIPGGYISITNTESMYHGLRIPGHGEFIRNADFSLCDGVGVIVAGFAWGHKITRFNGPILQLECCRVGVEKGWRHYFYGGKEGVADEMASKLTAQFPGLIVAGCYAPPFRQQSAKEDEQVVQMINETEPHFVWVGLGLVKQEQWIAEHLDRINAPWMVGVGAAFDYHSGAIPWAPAPLRAVGLEWLFRLIIQPRLRGKRYWWSFVFVVQSFLQGLVHKVFRNQPRRSS